MNDEKFVLNKSNKIMILINVIALIVVGVTIIFLVNSYKNEVRPLPNLRIVEGRTSTSYARETTTQETTSVTTTKALPTASPYYSYDVSEYINEELRSNKNISKEEKLTLLEQYFKFFTSFFDMGDYSIFDTDTVFKAAKVDEEDVITVDGHRYALIYDGFEKLSSYMTIPYKNGVTYKKYKDIQVFQEKNGKLYRIENMLDDVKLILSDVKITSFNEEKIVGQVKYYFSNYKEEGYTAPVYKSATITLKYGDEKKWVIGEYTFPYYE